MTAPQWQLDQVSLRPVRGAPLLQELSCEIAPGDRCALLGASGAGKTTLLRLLNRLVEPTHGQILFAGRELRQIPIAQLRQQVTLAAAEPRLLGMTVQEAIAYPLKLRRLPPATRQARIAAWVDRLQIPSDWLDRNEVQLSASQRQWVALARAFACESLVLLLDEPTALLERDRQIQLFELLQSTLPTTIVLASRDVEAVRSWAQRVLYLDRGQLLEQSITQLDWHKVQEAIEQNEAASAAEWDE